MAINKEGKQADPDFVSILSKLSHYTESFNLKPAGKCGF